MEISVAWLRALAPTIAGEAEELGQRLSLQAVAVDKIEHIGRGLEDVVVGRVLSAERHPKADRLTLCQVDAGGEPVEVVCGAPNVVEGALYPFVGPGGSLPGGFQIECRQIRGVVSNGMLCSEQELGIGRDSDGILRLQDGIAPGTPVARALALPDARLTLDLTPNRVDMACHLGVARELAPGGVADISLPSLGVSWLPEWVDGESSATAAGVTVRIDDAERCHRYLAAVVRGVRVGPSPDWLQSRLRAAGARPINNLVDATNYVLLESNQPLHAFDLVRIGSSEIRIRAASAGETLTTLDGSPHELDGESTVIADASRPIALAGVMGGEDSEVTPDTSDVLIECAWFDPRHTRRTAERAGLSTDASYRFERGVDEAGMATALQRCVELILAAAGGKAEPVALRVGRPPEPAPEVRLRVGRVRRVLGLRLSGEQIVGLLKPLGFEFGDPSADSPEPELRVRIPSWRNDVRREVDLLEEVARLYGYESFPDESRSFRPTTVPDDPMWLRRDRISRLLTARGFLEARGLPMVAARRARADCVKLLNPLSETESVLRTDLVPPLIDRLEHNFSRGHRAIRLFEIGTVFRRLPAVSAESDVRDRYDEEVRVALVMTGASRSEHWSATAEDTDIWDLLGVTEQISDLLPEVVLRPGLPAGETPGFGLDGWLGDDRIAMFDGDALVGVAGAIRSDAVDSPPWAGAAFAAEFRLNAVGLRRGAPFRELPTYPSTRRDLALLVPAGVTASSVEAAIRDAAPTELESLRVFDVYEAAGAADGGRSIAWRLVFRAADRTLTDGEVEACVERIVTKLREELDVRVRES